MPKFVLLWTDVVLWGLALLGLWALWRVCTQPKLQATWGKVVRSPSAFCSGILLAMFAVVALVDSIHFRLPIPAAPGQPVYHATTTDSLLDVVLSRQLAMRETQYSAPLAYQGFAVDAVEGEQGSVRTYPRLAHGGAHLSDPATEWAQDVRVRAFQGAGVALAVVALCLSLLAWGLARTHGGWSRALRDVLADRTHWPWRAVLVMAVVLACLIGPTIALMGHYHVLGTDQTGNDVLVRALKSIRTAFVIGTLATLATLPLAIGLGVLAGYFKGWVDELIQYLYTVLSSVPSVLLIAACVLMVQVYLDQNPDQFETGLERADIKIFLLCVILGLTGWATLCRLVRAETLKLRELDYVQAATAFGVGHVRIMWRHIVPNVMHLVLITTVLGFSDLILYEAVLTYVGVGVDPSTSSFGGMINLARSEMSRDPVVWWSFLAAFGFMVTLVLAANLFADGVRDAFDPRARLLRPRWSKRPA